MQQITPFFFKHNAEAEAIDLLMEVGRLEELIEHVDKTNCDRICGYLGSLAMYVPEPEDSMVLTVAVNALRKLERYPEALMMAVRLGDDALLEEILTACDDPYVTPHHPAPLLPPLPAPPPARRTHDPSPTPHRLPCRAPAHPSPIHPSYLWRRRGPSREENDDRRPKADRAPTGPDCGTSIYHMRFPTPPVSKRAPICARSRALCRCVMRPHHHTCTDHACTGAHTPARARRPPRALC